MHGCFGLASQTSRMRTDLYTRDTHQCRNILAQPAIQYVASLVLVHWKRNGISRARDLTAVFAIDHAPVELHSDWLHPGSACTV